MSGRAEPERGSGSLKVAEARFAALDLLRGLAAIAVLLVHFRYGPTGVTLAQKGYLAVDFFFVLSGFVVAHAYEQRLRRGTWLGPFCLTRLLRLYPLYAFASIIGIAAVYFQPGTDRDTGHWAVSILLAVFFLPTPSQFSANPGSLYPFNFAAWSLFWELAVNLLYGVAALQLDKRLLSLLIALGAAGVAVICLSGFINKLIHKLKIVSLNFPSQLIELVITITFRKTLIDVGIKLVLG
jgi:peptidoglycan/LPS O-acetylase OafA/YrhL